jgi:putative ABC transport system permease protein
MFNQKDWGYSNLSVKINGSKASDALAFIKSTWQKNLP